MNQKFNTGYLDSQSSQETAEFTWASRVNHLPRTESQSPNRNQQFLHVELLTADHQPHTLH